MAGNCLLPGLWCVGVDGGSSAHWSGASSSGGRSIAVASCLLEAVDVCAHGVGESVVADFER